MRDEASASGRRVVDDGPEADEKLHSVDEVFMSGYADPSVEQALPDGCGLMEKPFTTHTLLSRVRESWVRALSYPPRRVFRTITPAARCFAPRG